MSYDRKLDQVCQHVVANEALYVRSDRRTIQPLRPIASMVGVSVRLNGSITVPHQGVQTVPSGLSTRWRTFKIETGVNDTFTFRVNNQAQVSQVVVPASVSYTADQLMQVLNDAKTGLIFSNVENRIEFRSPFAGVAATVFLPSTCTLGAYLGMPVNHEYRGKSIAPGWSLISAPRTLGDRPTRYIVFDTPLRSTGDVVEITYATLQQDCRRCGGVGVENDWRYTKTGDVIEVRDEALLIQEILKLLYTEAGSNPFHSWYGTSLLDQIGQKLGVGTLVQNIIVSDIYRAFGRWQSIKRQQEIAIGQFVSDSEYPFRLLSVNVQQSSSDPTVFFVSMTVQNRSGQPILIDRGVRIPQPTDLLGSTQQQGIFRESLRGYTLSG